MKWLENLTGGYKPSAKIIDNTLILSLPDAVSPVVWRMELDNVKSAAFEIKQGKDNLFTLVMTADKDDRKDIAPFDSRDKAVRALMAASEALENGAAANQNINMGAPHAPKKPKGNLIAAALGIVLLIGFFVILSNAGPHYAADPRAGGLTADTGARTAANRQTSPQDTGGVPLSADAFLSGR